MGKRRLGVARPDGVVNTLLGRPVEAELDLHGLNAREASIRVEGFLARWILTKPGAIVRVITGKGNRSAGQAVLGPLVGRLLRDAPAGRVARFVADQGGGAYLVQLGAREDPG